MDSGLVQGHYRKVRNRLVDGWIVAALNAGPKTLEQLADCIGPANANAREIRCRLYGLEVRGVVAECTRLIGKHEKRWRVA